MIYLVIWTCVAVILTFGVLLRLATQITGKSLNHLFAEVKAHVAFDLIGIQSIVDDFLYKGQNKIEPITKTGKIAVITGGTRGIGYEVIKLLLQCDIHVIMGCRKVADGEKVLAQIRADGVATGELKVFQLDTSSNDSVREFARCVQDNHSQIHYLINNAGIMFVPYRESVDGYESVFATNYLGHFLLTHLLMPQIEKGGNLEEHARIVNVSSCIHSYGEYTFDDMNKKKQYVPGDAYATSKLAQIHFTTHLNGLMTARQANVRVFAVHPGVVNTELFDNTFMKQYFQWFMNFVFKSPTQGAYSIVYATISPKLENEGGVYISNCGIKELKGKAKDCKMAEQLFNYTNGLLNIREFGK